MDATAKRIITSGDHLIPGAKVLLIKCNIGTFYVSQTLKLTIRKEVKE